jgi:hypothetical protein
MMEVWKEEGGGEGCEGREVGTFEESVCIDESVRWEGL